MGHWLKIENFADRNGVEVKLSFRLIRVKRYFISLTSALFEMASTRFESGRERRIFFKFWWHILYSIWIVTITISIILFIRDLDVSTFLSMTNVIAADQEFDRTGGNTSFLAKEHIGVRNDIFKEIHTWASRRHLWEISRFNIPRHAASRALFPRKCILSEGRQLRGVAISGAARENPGGLRRRLFLWETNSRIRPTSTISGEASGGTEASKVRSDESRAQESWMLWKRGVALRGLRVPRQGSRDSVLILQIKGKFEIPTTCSKRRAFHHLFSSPSLRLRP